MLDEKLHARCHKTSSERSYEATLSSDSSWVGEENGFSIGCHLPLVDRAPTGLPPLSPGCICMHARWGCSASAAVGGRGESACGPSEVGVVQLCPCTMWGTGEASAARSVSSSETAPLFKDRPKQFLRPLWLVSKVSRHPILAAETEDAINITSARNPEPVLAFSYTFQFLNSLVSMNPAFLRLFSFPLSHSWFLALILTVSFLEYCKYFPISFPTCTS